MASLPCIGIAFFARFGATRVGSPAIFGYCGGHGASPSPDAASLAAICNKGCKLFGLLSIGSHGSPCAALRCEAGRHGGDAEFVGDVWSISADWLGLKT